MQLGSIVARTRGPLTTRFHRSLHTYYATEAGKDATGVDFKLPHGADFRTREVDFRLLHVADFRSCLLGIALELMK
jgi:hypothetical protein